MKPTDEQDGQLDGQLEDEELVGRLVAAAGPRPELPDALRERWETSFKRALADELSQRSRWRQVSVGGVVAAALALAVTLVAVWTPTKAHPIAQVAAASGANERADHAPLRVGENVFIGETIRTGPSGSIAFRYRDADLRMSNNTVLEFHGARVRLLMGTVYVDSGAPGERPVGAPSVMVETSRGSLTHVGTQFLVTMTDAALVAAVREGSIALRTDRYRRQLAADQETAAMVRVSAAGELMTSHIEPSGGIWAWVPVASPGVTFDARTADSLLSWIARETGRAVHYSTPQVRAHAAITELRGELGGLSVEAALAAVTGTTHLSVVESPTTMTVGFEAGFDPLKRDEDSH